MSDAKIVYIVGASPIDTCGCHYCANEWLHLMHDLDPDGWMSRINAYGMILCPECGAKRCPRATHHDHTCTRSNEQGQVGSVYGDYELDDSWTGDDDE